MVVILGSHTAYNGAAENGCNHLVERYSCLTTKIMSYLSSHRSLSNYARAHRKHQQFEESAYTQLFTQAQKDIGIADGDILPVKTVALADTDNKEGFAFTGTSYVGVIDENFSALPYGAQRIISLHEAFHHKYHDGAFSDWALRSVGMSINISTLTALLGSLVLVNANSSGKLRVAGNLAVPIVSYIVSFIFYSPLIRPLIEIKKQPSSYDIFKEFRADRDAVAHVGCYKCVEEYTILAGPDTYLTVKDLTVYTQYFKTKKMLCAHHAASNIQTTSK